MKKVWFNGKIYVEKDSFAQAVCFEGEHILKVGTDADVLAFAGGCAAVDLCGKTVIPGLNDSHMHLLHMGRRLAAADLAGADSIDAVVDRCRRFIAQNPEATREGLMAGGWNQDHFTSGEKRYLNRHDLDRIATDRPVVLKRVCGHILAANTRAVELTGLDGGSPQPEGGLFGLGEDGRPDGIFAEQACALAERLIPQAGGAILEELTGRAMEYCVAHGLTSVQSNDIGQSGVADAEVFDLLCRLYTQGRGKLRYRHQMCFDGPQEFLSFFSNCAELRRGMPPWLALGPLKLFKDGSLGARTATLRRPYLDDPGNSGVEALSAELAESMLALADQNGVQVLTHAIGDRAIADTLDACARVLRPGQNPLRHAIVHFQCLDPELIARAAEMKVPALVQPIFLHTDIHAVGSRLTPDANRWFLPLKSCLDAGVRLAFGSDAPVEDCNPFLGIYCAVTRRDCHGRPAEGFFPQERLTVADAIDCFTVGSAYAEFQEGCKGRIKPGFLADMVVLDTDIFTCAEAAILTTRPLETVVGGTTVYRA